jgi:hypothetical protein
MELYNTFINSLKTYTHIFYKNMLFRYINKPNYLEFIYLKGLFLLKNIYSLLHFNNINSNETKNILEKAYIYFIEFLIQININSANFELTLKDAVMFTYKKTILSYKYTANNKNIIQKNLDNNLNNNLNSICNIFYIVNNANFIEHLNNNQTNENEEIQEECINNFITNKINAIKTLEKELLNFIANNTDLHIDQLNNDLIDLRANMEKTIESLYNTKCYVKIKDYNINMLNNIVLIIANKN